MGQTQRSDLASTGVPGLDEVLLGGLLRNRLYLVEGVPGVGKTTLGMQFLLEGVRNDEVSLYLGLSETEEDLRAVASSHGWNLEGIHVAQFVASEELLRPEGEFTVFRPSDVELGSTMKAILEAVEKWKPDRVFMDSLADLRLLTDVPARHRRQLLALKQFFAGKDCTVLVADDKGSARPDEEVEALVHGVIRMEKVSPAYGADRRRLQVAKMRGRKFLSGYHEFVIRDGGAIVFPRLVAAESRTVPAIRLLSSGIARLDSLLGGGVRRGASTLLKGPSGTGRSTVAMQFAVAEAQRGGKAAMYLFDEGPESLLPRADGLGIGLRAEMEAGRVELRQIDPAEMGPGEFVSLVRQAVEEQQVGVVVIDTLNGYLAAMPDETYLVAQLHELFSYLRQHEVAVFTVLSQTESFGISLESPVDTSYLSDAILLFRFFEYQGEVRQAVSVVKKRSGPHERTLREIRLTSKGIWIGEPLREFQGVLTGVPNLTGPPVAPGSEGGAQTEN